MRITTTLLTAAMLVLSTFAIAAPASAQDSGVSVERCVNDRSYCDASVGDECRGGEVRVVVTVVGEDLYRQCLLAGPDLEPVEDVVRQVVEFLENYRLPFCLDARPVDVGAEDVGALLEGESPDLGGDGDCDDPRDL